MNLTERIQDVIEQADAYLSGDSSESAQQLLQILAALSSEIESLVEGWESPPPTLQAEIEKLDNQFLAASDSYLDACDKVKEALETSQLDRLDEAEDLLNRGRNQLLQAQQSADEHYRKLMGGDPPLKPFPRAEGFNN